ncbi:uncharacterized protein M6B38_365700 [Iris pallida]|uniref:DUF6821 domain-containing protein n=1 Tax=Iris pallida TaxID=29817 RepID=A0AAX6GHB7_IRIPA|nr:uncharacterized protein M6B38_365700 [Iris pallida]
MEKSSCMDMDIEDWELLQVPNATAFEFGLDTGKDLPLSETNFGGAAAFVDSHYFFLPSKNQELRVENSTPAKAAREEEEEEEEELEPLVEFKDIGVDHYSLPELGSRENIVASPISSGDDEDDGKYSLSRRSRREEGTDDDEEEEEGCVDDDAEEKPCRRWRLVGGTVAGALCSIAAAVICVVALGGRRQPNYQTRSRSQRLPFQIYADEKRIKQVMQQATRLNHTLTAARGVPTTTTRTTRADISFGGYYDGLWSEL